MKKNLFWVEFRKNLDALEERSGYAALDVTAQRVLEWIAEAEETLPVIHVQTVIMKSGVASPATLHKNLAVLEQEGFLSVTVDQEDTRRRVIKTTPKTRNLFDRLGSELLKDVLQIR